MQRIRNQEFDLLFCSPPCNTWSRAAFANSTGPAPLRNADFPEGLPWLEGYLKTKAELGTQLVRKTLELVKLCSSLGMPWLVEHPEFLGKSPRGTPASIWTWQESRSCFESCHAATVCFHQCSYGAPYAKPTRLAGTWPNLSRLGYIGWPQVDSDGRYRGPLPRSCGHEHPRLIGQDESGSFKTAPTAAYPSRLCRAVARLAWDFVLPAAASVGGAIRSTAGDLHEDSLKTMAASILVPSSQQLLQIIEFLPGEKPSRGDVMPGAKSFTTGAYSVGGGLAGVRANTRTFPEVSALLCRYITSLQHEFSFMAAAVFVNLRTSPHRDLGNLSGSLNLVAGVGSFSGGEVWVSSDSGSVPCPFSGFSELGELLPTSGTFAVFNPRNLHCTAEWSGNRIVVVGFTPYFGGSMDAADVEFLENLGFKPPNWVASTDRAPLDQVLDANNDRPGQIDWAEWEDLDADGASSTGSTSEEDEDGVAKPAYGAGKLGVGPPLKTELAGKPRFFSDGHGLASPGRWAFGQRSCGSFDSDLGPHNDIMQGLLQLLSSKLDIKLELCKLATGRAQSSPFPGDLIGAGRDLVFRRLREAGSMADLDKVAERQPFYLEAVGELLRLAGDPDWRRYSAATWSFAKGVPLGVDVRLPRTPALFPRKSKHRIYPEADRVFDGELRDNYSSAKESAEQIEQQFEQEVQMGAMVRCDLDQARAEYGDELTVASLGAVPKSDQTVRVVHDATHGLRVNDRIRVRDAQNYPTGADLKVVEIPSPFELIFQLHVMHDTVWFHVQSHVELSA